MLGCPSCQEGETVKDELVEGRWKAHQYLRGQGMLECLHVRLRELKGEQAFKRGRRTMRCRPTYGDRWGDYCQQGEHDGEPYHRG